MTAFNRVGVYTANAHTGLLMNILRKEWGFKGLESQDFIQGANYAVLKEYAMNGGTMTCNTGDSTMAAVSEKWDYWTVENVSKDTALLSAIKQAMTWQAYALANSNAMDGLRSHHPSGQRPHLVRQRPDRRTGRICGPDRAERCNVYQYGPQVQEQEELRRSYHELSEKTGAGTYLTALTAIASVVGFAFYMVNCGTNYFKSQGTNPSLPPASLCPLRHRYST